MGNFWQGSTQLSVPNLDNCAPPLFDCTIGTDGTYTSINDAIAAGAVRIAVLPGATITAAVTFASASGVLFGIAPLIQIVGNYVLTISGDGVLVRCCRFGNTAGVGLLVTGNRIRVDSCNFQSCGSHGLHLNGSSGAHHISNCTFYGNGGDGIRAELNNQAAISNCRSQTNTGYGINDIVNNCLVSTTWVYANTAGSISGSKTYVDSSCYGA